MTLERKPIPEETWPLLDRMDLAFRLEAHLLPEDSARVRNMPEFMREVLEVTAPQGIGWNKYTGWFVLSSGHGPCIDFIENEHVMVPKHLIEQLREATKARRYETTLEIVEHLASLSL